MHTFHQGVTRLSRTRTHDISAHAEHVFTTVAGCIVRRVDHISNPNNHGDDRWDTVYAKLNLWAMVEFKKVPTSSDKPFALCRAFWSALGRTFGCALRCRFGPVAVLALTL